MSTKQSHTAFGLKLVLIVALTPLFLGTGGEGGCSSVPDEAILPELPTPDNPGDESDQLDGSVGLKTVAIVRAARSPSADDEP